MPRKIFILVLSSLFISSLVFAGAEKENVNVSGPSDIRSRVINEEIQTQRVSGVKLPSATLYLLENGMRIKDDLIVAKSSQQEDYYVCHKGECVVDYQGPITVTFYKTRSDLVAKCGKDSNSTGYNGCLKSYADKASYKSVINIPYEKVSNSGCCFNVDIRTKKYSKVYCSSEFSP